MFLLAGAIFFIVTYNKIKERGQKKMKNRCKKHVEIKSAVMNTKKREKNKAVSYK